MDGVCPPCNTAAKSPWVRRAKVLSTTPPPPRRHRTTGALTTRLEGDYNVGRCWKVLGGVGRIHLQFLIQRLHDNDNLHNIFFIVSFSANPGIEWSHQV